MMPESTYLLALQGIAFFWGAAWGSFLNVVIYRLPAGLSLVHPPSRCSTCETQIRWYDNLPILSYVLLRGRCRACKTRFSPRYALIEAACGFMSLAIFKAAFADFSPTTIWLQFGHWLFLQLFVYALIVIIFIDLEHFFIPDEISLPTIALGLLGAYLLPMYDFENALYGAVAGGGFMLLIFGVGWVLFRREALGLGDAKLMALIGTFLGWKPLVFVLFASSVQALVAVLVVRMYSRFTGREDTFTKTTEELDEYFEEEERYAGLDLKSRTVIPYGPFLSLAALEALFIGDAFFWNMTHTIANAFI